MPHYSSMLNKPDGLDQPRGNQIIWRYLSLDKFYRLLIEKQLHFRRADLFSDKNEFEVVTHSLAKDLPKSSPTQTVPESLLLRMRVFQLKRRTFVNCWSLGANESYALWKIYLGGSRSGVAIRTTVSKLGKALKLDPRLQISCGGVKYANYLPLLDLKDHEIVCSKLKAYRYENEYRLWIYGDQLSSSQPDDISLDIDLETLIETIYLSPFSNGWFGNTFQHTIDRLVPGLKFKLRTSGVRDA